MRQPSTSSFVLIAIISFALCAYAYSQAEAMTSTEAAPPRDEPEFPESLRGAWDIATEKCNFSPDTGSDTRIEIASHTLQGYESTDQLTAVEKISSSPEAWRIVTVSNIAPPDPRRCGHLRSERKYSHDHPRNDNDIILPLRLNSAINGEARPWKNGINHAPIG